MKVLRLTLRQLQIIVAVAHKGSTTAASAEIALSQSATGSELERLLSLRLFDRAGKRLLLNDNGRALLPRALALLDGAIGIEPMSRDAHAQMQSLHMGASTTIGNCVLPKLLARFVSKQGPGSASAWRSKVVIDNTAAICDAVAAFELDIGLIEGPCHQEHLEVTPWLQDEMVSCGSAAAPAFLSPRRVGQRRTTGAPGDNVAENRAAVPYRRAPAEATNPDLDPLPRTGIWRMPCIRLGTLRDQNADRCGLDMTFDTIHQQQRGSA